MFPYNSNAHLGLVESFSQPNLLGGMMYTDGNLHHALYEIFDSYSWDGHREHKICLLMGDCTFKKQILNIACHQQRIF